MKLRWLPPAALAVLLLAGCVPDSVSPGGESSPTPHPSVNVTPSGAAAPTPSQTERTNDPYDY